MNFRERHLATFRREPLDRVLWQPRLEHWINVNRREGTLPARYRELSHLAIYDDLDCSPRGYFMFNRCLRVAQGGEVEITAEEIPGGRRQTWRTPVGEISQVWKRTATAHQTVQYPVQSPGDFPVLEYLLRHQQVSWDDEAFRQADAELGDRAAPTIYVPRINLQRLIIEYIGFENTMFMLFDEPAAMERLIETINETDDAIYKVVCACPVEIINFGDNVDANLLGARLFERHLLPIYQKRSAQLRAAGKKSHAHWDGFCKPLLPYIKETGLDGIEAITPLPQGDVTLEETREAMGEDQILVDGIPCTHFLEQTSYAELEEFTKRTIDLFGARLVLGISDEISPPGDIEKVRRVSEIVADYAL